MQIEFLHLHVQLLLYWALDLNELQQYCLAIYGSLFHCSEQKQVQNDSSVLILLSVAKIRAAKNQFSLVYFVDRPKCL